MLDQSYREVITVGSNTVARGGFITIDFKQVTLSL
jgi:hypothetical protein